MGYSVAMMQYIHRIPFEAEEEFDIRHPQPRKLLL